MAENFLARAFVQVKPDIRGFKTALNTNLRNSLREFSVPVKVTPAVRGFKKALNEQLSVQPIEIPVIPDVTKFREELLLATEKASKGVTVGIPVNVISTGGGDSVREEKALGDAIEETGKQTDKATSKSKRRSEAQKLQQTINRALKVSETERLAALDKTLSTEEKALHLSVASRSAETATAQAAQLAAISNTKAAEALRLRAFEQAALVGTTKKEIRDAADLAAAETALSNARKEVSALIKQEVIAIDSKDSVEKAEIRLDELATSVKKALAAARAANADAAIAELTAIQSGVARQREALRGTTVAFNEQDKAARKAAAGQKQAARGAIATSLSFLKIRGATLAAGSEFLAGAAAVAVFAKAVQSAASLQSELNVFQITAGASADEMARVGEEARKLGADITLPAVSATDAAAAFTDLAKAGLKTQDAIDGARGVLQLATAAQIENSQATELVASALNSFSLAGTDATHVADLLAGASIAAQGSIEDMGIALQQSSAVARQAGLNLEDTVAFITLLAKNGLRGSDAGTSLRTALLRLISPTDDAQKSLQQLGVTILDTSGRIRPEAFAELAQSLQSLEPIARNQTLRKIFGQDAIRAAVIFGREGSAGLNAAREATNQAGLAAQLAGARTKGFAGKVEALKNSLSTLGITVGELVIGPLATLIDGFNQVTTAINSAIDALKDFNDDLANVPGLKRLGDELQKTFVDQPKEMAKETSDAFKDSAEPFVGFARFALGQLQGSAKDTNKEIQKIFATFKESRGGTTDFNAAAVAMQKLVDKLADGDAEAQRLAERVRIILKFMQDTGHLPPVDLNIEKFILPQELPDVPVKGVITFESQLDPRSIFNVKKQVKDTAKEEADRFKLFFGQELSPAVMAALGVSVLKNFGEGAKGEASKQGTDVANAFRLSLDDQLAIAEASGQSDSVTLQKLRAREKRQKALFDELNAIPKASRTKAQSARLATVAANLNATRAAIDDIVTQNEADAKAAADKADESRKKAASDTERIFGKQEQQAINKQTLAAATEGFEDDLKADQALLRLYIRQRAQASKKIKDAEALRDFLADVNQKIFQVNQDIKKDRKSLNQQLRQEDRDRRERIQTGLNLDIEFAEITGNRKLEISLRRKLIKALEDQIKHEKGNTNKIKELRNEIARQKQAIKEVDKEAKGRLDAFQKLSFTFLQTIAGFNANLIGNLIPFSASGGLVGGSNGGGAGLGLGSPAAGGSSVSSGSIPGLPGFHDNENRGPRLPGSPAKGIASAATADSATRDRGVTRGQGQTTNHLLRMILAQLTNLNRGMDHPEAAHQRKKGAAAFDYGYQGPGM